MISGGVDLLVGVEVKCGPIAIPALPVRITGYREPGDSAGISNHSKPVPPADGIDGFQICRMSINVLIAVSFISLEPVQDN